MNWQEEIWPPVWPPLLLLVVATAPILLFILDFRFQQLFFIEEHGWWLMHRPLLVDIYDYRLARLRAGRLGGAGHARRPGGAPAAAPAAA